MKRKMTLILLASAIVVCMLFVGNVYAIYVETGIIDVQPVHLPTPYNAQIFARIDGNLTSWLKAEILPTKMYEWEWITIGDPAAITYCVIGSSGQVYIQFPSYITIRSVSISLPYNGGPGVNWITVILSGQGNPSFSLQTNHISSQYYGNSVPVYMQVNAGIYQANKTYSIQI